VWPAVLTTGVGAIVDRRCIRSPSSSRREDHRVRPVRAQVVTRLTSLAVFVPNPHYGGNDVLHTVSFIIRYAESATTLVSDEQQGATRHRLP